METQPAKWGSTHIKRIDVSRGVAILSVISFHFLAATYDHPDFQGNLIDFGRPSLIWWIFSP
jgi:peptidoglycan/LPS O-acetylase OafA/YrhL